MQTEIEYEKIQKMRCQKRDRLCQLGHFDIDEIYLGDVIETYTIMRKPSEICIGPNELNRIREELHLTLSYIGFEKRQIKLVFEPIRIIKDA